MTTTITTNSPATSRTARWKGHRARSALFHRRRWRPQRRVRSDLASGPADPGTLLERRAAQSSRRRRARRGSRKSNSTDFRASWFRAAMRSGGHRAWGGRGGAMHGGGDAVSSTSTSFGGAGGGYSCRRCSHRCSDLPVTDVTPIGLLLEIYCMVFTSRGGGGDKACVLVSVGRKLYHRSPAENGNDMIAAHTKDWKRE